MNNEEKELEKQCKNWREEGCNIVFTNGCFDLLHQGHLDLLSKAAEYGNRLIVGLNSDKSVKILKGKDRPIQTQTIRKDELIKLKYVDTVSIFDEETPLRIIGIIKPDFLVKGGDYKKNEIVGSSDMKKWGGSVKIIPLTYGYSTTKTIEKNKLEGLV